MILKLIISYYKEHLFLFTFIYLLMKICNINCMKKY